MIRRKKVQIEMLVGIVSFYLVWIPYIICAIIIILGGGVKHEVLIAATFCTKFGVIINPIVFVFRNRDVSLYQSHINSYIFYWTGLSNAWFLLLISFSDHARKFDQADISKSKSF